MAEIDYLELPAGDLAATKDFYTAVFGWEWTDYGPTYAASTSGTVEVALNAEASAVPAHDPGSENASGPFVLLRTDDLTAVRDAVVAAGGTVLTEPYPYPGGSRFHLQDPSGNVLGVYRPDEAGEGS